MKELRTFEYGSRRIDYQLQRTNREAISITVHPDLSVSVSTPPQAGDAAVEKILRRRASWILKQQRFFTQFIPRTPERQYIGGETHLYLGKQYQLRIREAEREQVKLEGSYIVVLLPDVSDRERVKALLLRWYRRRARRLFRDRLAHCLERTEAWGIPAPRLQLRKMAKRWGSCSRANTLTLNPDLVRAPRACVDYVITHELCHLKHYNHSREFYFLLTALMPDWQDRKQLLEKVLS